jgi:hypothetical protein
MLAFAFFILLFTCSGKTISYQVLDKHFNAKALCNASILILTIEILLVIEPLKYTTTKSKKNTKKIQKKSKFVLLGRQFFNKHPRSRNIKSCINIQAKAAP